MRLIGTKVLVEILEPNQQTAAGIILPADKQDKNKGKVLFVGSGVEYLKVGDTVRYYPNSGTYYEFDGKRCLFLREDQDIEVVL